jgi:two-component system sensor histidine kinase KdpD
MVHGNIYPEERVPQALSNFFRTDNLIAQRELALRFLADETDDQWSATFRDLRTVRQESPMTQPKAPASPA